MPALKARISAGVATETIVESTRIMKNTRTSAHSDGHASLGTTTSLGGAAADAASWVVTSASAMRGLCLNAVAQSRSYALRYEESRSPVQQVYRDNIPSPGAARCS